MRRRSKSGPSGLALVAICVPFAALGFALVSYGVPAGPKSYGEAGEIAPSAVAAAVPLVEAEAPTVVLGNGFQLASLETTPVPAALVAAPQPLPATRPAVAEASLSSSDIVDALSPSRPKPLIAVETPEPQASPDLEAQVMQYRAAFDEQIVPPMVDNAATVFLASAPFGPAAAPWGTVADPGAPPPGFTGFDVTRVALPGNDGKRKFFGGLTEAEFRAKEKRCMAIAIYFEARSEPVEGQVAVAQTIMNRVRSPYYPATVCGVVYQGADMRNNCQFSFACDGVPDVPRERAQWELANELADKVLNGKVYLDSIGNASHYHAVYVRPDWLRQMSRVARIGQHIFYRAENLPTDDTQPRYVP